MSENKTIATYIQVKSYSVQTTSNSNTQMQTVCTTLYLQIRTGKNKQTKKQKNTSHSWTLNDKDVLHEPKADDYGSKAWFSDTFSGFMNQFKTSGGDETGFFQQQWCSCSHKDVAYLEIFKHLWQPGQDKLHVSLILKDLVQRKVLQRWD